MFATPTKPAFLSRLDTRHNFAVIVIWLLIHLVLLSPLLQAPWHDTDVEVGDVKILRQVDWRVLYQETSPADWQTASLPHLHADNLGKQPIEYRSAFAIQADPSGQQTWGICIPQWASRSDVSLDGQIIQAAHRGVDLNNEWTRAQFFALPQGIAAGEHLLTLTLMPVKGFVARLSEIFVAPSELAQAACDRLARQNSWTDLLRSAFAVLGLVALWLAWSTKDPSAVWFGVLAVSVEVAHRVLLHPLLPLTDVQWIRTVVSLCAALELPLYFFVVSSAGHRSPRMDRVVPVLVILQILASLLWPMAWWKGWLICMGLLWLVLGAWLVQSMARSDYSSKSSLRNLLSACVLLSMMAVAWDVTTFLSGHNQAVFLMPATGLAFATTFLASIVLRMTMAEAQGQAVRSDMAHQLACQKTELVRSFELIQQSQAKEAQMQERSRIMRELHDGLGSHLVAASVLLSSGQHSHKELTDQIDSCLNELRTIVDFFGVEFHDVSEMLGSFRDRIEPVLAAQGIGLDWQVQAMPATASLNDNERLHVMRIVQEAFTNILKHSGASQVILRAQTRSPGCSVIDIIDNGQGLRPVPHVKPGRGLSNIQTRALLLNAELKLIDTPRGFHVSLALNTHPEPQNPLF